MENKLFIQKNAKYPKLIIKYEELDPDNLKILTFISQFKKIEIDDEKS